MSDLTRYAFLGFLTGLGSGYAFFWIMPLQMVYWMALVGMAAGIALAGIRRSRLAHFIAFPLWGASGTGIITMLVASYYQPESVTLMGSFSTGIGLLLGTAIAFNTPAKE